MRGKRAESESCQLDIVQEAPGGVASVEIEDVGVTILPLALDGVVAGEERVNLESSAVKCILLSNEDRIQMSLTCVHRSEWPEYSW